MEDSHHTQIINPVRKPLKVLHVLGSLRHGGIETWLINILRQRRPELAMDFLIHAQPEDEGSYAVEARKLGSQIFHREPTSRLRRRLQILGLARTPSTLRDRLVLGDYDAVHVHGDEFLGDAMREAYLAGTRVRVAHSHHVVLARGKTGLEMTIRRLRHNTLDRYRTLKYSTKMLACSRDAGLLLAGSAWDKDPRCSVLYCGIPLRAFKSAAQRCTRQDLLIKYRLPADSIVIGHVGSMGPTPIKNHHFLVRVFAELSKRSPRYRLFLAGDGPLRPSIAQLVNQLNVSDKVVMPGVVDDIPALMSQLYDVHVMPSTLEGFGMVVTEATAAGLFSVIADSVPGEVSSNFPGRTKRVSLSESLETWADAIQHGLALRESNEKGIERVRGSTLDIDCSISNLIDIYSGN